MVDINLLSSKPQPPQQPVVQPIDQKNIPAGTVRQRHLQTGYTMVKFGIAADRPTTSNEIILYFATDTFVLSYFDTTTQTWKSGSAFT